MRYNGTCTIWIKYLEDGEKESGKFNCLEVESGPDWDNKQFVHHFVEDPHKKHEIDFYRSFLNFMLALSLGSYKETQSVIQQLIPL